MNQVLTMAAGRGDRGGMMGRGHDGFGWGGPAMLICFVVFVAAAAVLVWLLTRRQTPAMAGPATPVAPVAPVPSPLANAEAILAERLARGEISPDDYRAAAAALRGQPVDTPAG